MSLQANILDTSKLTLTGNFETQVAYLLSEVRLSRQEVLAMQELMDDLKETLARFWPDCKVHPFGSIVTGMGIKTSDIDCYISLPNFVKHDRNLVNKAKRYLQTERHLFRDIFAIPMAKVPIVTFYHIPTQRSCDINFKSLAGVQNTSLLAYLLHLDPRALPLAIIIKYWSKVHFLTGTNLMPNYALTVLTVFYLQHAQVLPPVHHLQESSMQLIVENWNTAFREKHYAFFSNDSLSLYQLIGGFFDFYSNFDFATQIVSPYLGKPVPKESFKSHSSVPNEFSLYKDNIQNSITKSLKTDTAMCIQDPFDHSRNCAVAVHQRLFNKILHFIKNSSKIFYEVHSRGFLKAVLGKFEYKDVESPRMYHIVPGRVQKAKQKNRMNNNFRGNVHLIYDQYRKGNKRGK